MEPDERRKLERALELAEENNEMITKLHRAMQWGRVFKVVYWLVIIGVAVGAFYFAQPYLERVQSFYQEAQDSVQDVPSLFQGKQDQ